MGVRSRFTIYEMQEPQTRNDTAPEGDPDLKIQNKRNWHFFLISTTRGSRTYLLIAPAEAASAVVKKFSGRSVADTHRPTRKWRHTDPIHGHAHSNSAHTTQPRRHSQMSGKVFGRCPENFWRVSAGVTKGFGRCLMTSRQVLLASVVQKSHHVPLVFSENLFQTFLAPQKFLFFLKLLGPQIFFSGLRFVVADSPFRQV